jgi:acetyl-CoA acetyltransferase
MVAWNKAQRRVAIVAGARTPFTKMGGPLRDVHVSELAKVALQETLYRAHWPSERLDEVLLGNVVMPADATNLARVSALWAGVPWRVPADDGAAQLRLGHGSDRRRGCAHPLRPGRAILAGGAESMSTIPAAASHRKPRATVACAEGAKCVAEGDRRRDVAAAPLPTDRRTRVRAHRSDLRHDHGQDGGVAGAGVRRLAPRAG